MKQLTMKQTREAISLLSILDMIHVEGLAAGTVNENAARIEYKAQGGRPVRYINISSRARKANLDAIAAAVAEAIGEERWTEIVDVVTGEETETTEEPTETENAPQAATQAAEGTGEKKEDKTMTTTEREALERINARQNAANLFTNITPADIAREIEAMNDEQNEEENTMKQYSIKPEYYDQWGAYADNDIVTAEEIARLASEWEMTVSDLMEQVEEQTTEATTPDEQNEEVNTMSNTERYDYMEQMTEDVKDAIRERYTPDEIRARLDDDRDELAQELNDDLWTDDSVTGNASGSYYCNAWRAENAIAHNWDLIADMIDEFDAADVLRKGPEAIDVSIRCYLLGQAIDAALDQLDDEIPEAEEPDEDDGNNDADAISA